MPYFGHTITDDNQLKILDASWRGIQRVLAACFEAPEEYSLQKSIGVTAMHQVLAIVLEYLRTEGHYLTRRPPNIIVAGRIANAGWQAVQ